MKKKFLIFDLGGVMVWPRLGQWNIPVSIREIIGSRAEDIASPAYRAVYEKAARWLDEGQLVKDMDEEYILREKFIREIDAGMDWRMTEAEIAALARDFTYNIERYGFFPDVLPWLEKWKDKFSMGVLSDALPSALAFLEDWGVAKYMDAAVISAHVGHTKPGRPMYEAILQKLGADAEDCVFIDDRPCNLEGAGEAGIRGIQMARAEFMPDRLWEGPVARSFEEINTLIESGEIF